jgi:uncharacterized protein (TIGR02996 family)
VSIEEHLRANPDDAHAWLVYADQLLERGDPRGALVRTPRRLTTQEVKAWRGIIPAAAATRWLHGFVVAIELPIEARTPHTLAAILDEPEARLVGALCLRPASGSDDDCQVPQAVPVEGDALAAILASDLRRFRALAIQHQPLGEAGVRALVRVGPLVTLDLRYGALGDAGIERLVASPLLDGVRALHLQRNGITEHGARMLAASPKLAMLETLDLRFNPLGAAGAGALAASPHLGRLARLVVYPDDIGEAGVRALAASPRLPLATRRYWSARA